MADETRKFDKVSYNNAFNAQKYDRVTIMLPKGKKEILKKHAEACGESTNAFINRAIDEAMDRDNDEGEG